MPEIAKRIGVMETAVRRAGAELAARFQTPQAVHTKGDKSNIVTEADFASEKLLLTALNEHFPADGILSEEAGFAPGTNSFLWIVDPLDGTSNFAAGIPWFGVMAALVENDKVEAAAIYLPIQDAYYSARRGMGAAAVRGKSAASCRTTEATDAAEVLCAFGIDCSPDAGVQRRQVEMLAALAQRVQNLRATNSLIDLCFTLDAKVGACVNQSTKLWDVAAFSLLVTEAGGKISDLAGNPLNLAVTKDNYSRAVPIVAGGAHIQPQILEAICRTPNF